MLVGKKNTAQEYRNSMLGKNMETNRHKYIVIDSQNDQQYYDYNQYTNTAPILNYQRYRFNSDYSYPDIDKGQDQIVINKQIESTQRQLQKIQNQCQLLEQIINDMIKQQATLIVQQRKQYRSQSISQQQSNNLKLCPIHKNRNHSALISKNSKLINLQYSKMHGQSDKIGCLPQLSQDNLKYLQHKLKPFKTKQIKADCKIQQENITPKKKKKDHEYFSTKKNSSYSSKRSSCAKQSRV